MNDEWETPDDLYEKLNSEFGFQFDLCANKDNAKCGRWSGDVLDTAIAESEYSVFWMNPPYSRGNIHRCMDAALYLCGDGKTVVCLVRLDPTTDWFLSCVDGYAKEVRMLARRVKFKGADNCYNFPCCVVVFDGGRHDTDYYIWDWK